MKKVEPDLRWIQRLKSDLANSGEKIVKKSEEKKSVNNTVTEAGSYWLTRIVFLRFIAFIYLVAFLVSLHQNKELIGNNGLTPARNFLLNGTFKYFICKHFNYLHPIDSDSSLF